MHISKKSKILTIILCFIMFSILGLIKPNESYANNVWEADNVLISKVETNEGKLNSINVHFKVQEYFAECTYAG